MLIHNNFRSWCLQTNTDVDIIIPDPPQDMETGEYYTKEKNFPVLWLLHGTWGGYNDFVRRTNIDMYAKECKLMVVMPNAMNSDYSNWPDFMLGYNMYDFLTEELMPMIRNWFPASARREDNYICGLSMGAIGALKYTVNHPDLFGGCSAMSGTPVDVARLFKEGRLDKRNEMLVKMAGGIDGYLSSYENVWDRYKEVAKRDDSPIFYFSCGTEDFLYQNYQEFKRYSQENHCKAIFNESEGYGHEWRLWEQEIQRSLNVFGFHGKRNITVLNDGHIDATHL